MAPSDPALRSETSPSRQPQAPQRRCVLTGERGPRDAMIRFVQAPDGTILPDLAETLPGRGVWVTADREELETALQKGRLQRALARGLKRKLGPEQIPPDLADRIERLLLQRVQQRLGLERRAGRLALGFEGVKRGLETGRLGVLLEAGDGAWDGRRKLRALAGAEVTVVSSLSRSELSLALDRENVVHAGVDSGGGAQRLLRELERLARWRGWPLAQGAADSARQDERMQDGGPQE